MVIRAKQSPLDEDRLFQCTTKVVQHVFLRRFYVSGKVEQVSDDLLCGTVRGNLHLLVMLDVDKAALLDGLKTAITPLAYSQADYWFRNAAKEEILGAKVVLAVCETGGGELLSDLANTTLTQDDGEQSSHSPPASVYSSEYTHSTTKSKSEIELLRYHTLRELPYASILQPETFTFVESWLKLRDSEALVTALLAFLRGIHSVVKVNSIFPNSLQRATYVWYSKRDFIQAAHLRPRPKVAPALSSIPSAVSYSTRSPSPQFITLPKANESKALKQRELQGSTSLLRSVMSIPTFSSTYVSDYALHFKKPKRTKPLVSIRSTSLGLCPDVDEEG